MNILWNQIVLSILFVFSNAYQDPLLAQNIFKYHETKMNDLLERINHHRTAVDVYKNCHHVIQRYPDERVSSIIYTSANHDIDNLQNIDEKIFKKYNKNIKVSDLSQMIRENKTNEVLAFMNYNPQVYHDSIGDIVKITLGNTPLKYLNSVMNFLEPRANLLINSVVGYGALLDVLKSHHLLSLGSILEIASTLKYYEPILHRPTTEAYYNATVAKLPKNLRVLLWNKVYIRYSHFEKPTCTMFALSEKRGVRMRRVECQERFRVDSNAMKWKIEVHSIKKRQFLIKNVEFGEYLISTDKFKSTDVLKNEHGVFTWSESNQRVRSAIWRLDAQDSHFNIFTIRNDYNQEFMYSSWKQPNNSLINLKLNFHVAGGADSVFTQNHMLLGLSKKWHISDAEK